MSVKKQIVKTLFIFAIAALCCPTLNAEISIGQQVVDIEFKDIRYLTRRISEFKDCET